MDIVRNSAPRAGRIFAALGVLTASVLSAVVPAIVSADTITTRSIELSSSTKSASATYNVTFTTIAASTGVVEIDFCDTAAIDTACTAPDINTASVARAAGVAGTATSTNSGKGVKFVPTAPAAAGSFNVELSGITNPTTAQTMYARIVTYADDAAYTNVSNGYTDPSDVGTYLDDGSVALSITDGFSVSGSVLESLTFCASGAATTDCTGTTAPNIKLGTDGVLGTTADADGNVYTAVATNASSGAVVNLKSDALGCGGLYRDGVSNSTNCGISPVTTAAALSAPTAQFGAKLTIAQPTTINSGTGVLAMETGWSASNYFMPYVSDTDGVTSVYGAPVYNTSGAPTTFGTVTLGFNAHRAELTPAGNYTAKFNLIATGTF